MSVTGMTSSRVEGFDKLTLLREPIELPSDGSGYRNLVGGPWMDAHALRGGVQISLYGWPAKAGSLALVEELRSLLAEVA